MAQEAARRAARRQEKRSCLAAGFASPARRAGSGRLGFLEPRYSWREDKTEVGLLKQSGAALLAARALPAFRDQFIGQRSSRPNMFANEALRPFDCAFQREGA
jgi:hypothetical protein